MNLVGWFASSRGLAFVVLACVDNLGRYELVCSGNKVKQALDRLARRVLGLARRSKGFARISDRS